ncbi:MinD/ParA family ATP-binding protein [Kribbella shirazensis]|uniref:MinD-like ATPase involved in chromosome partitioning or flagellar assembly n=1 Tax=Kribbella shirazensis TaxID=1105143 RepID=A0A7X6A2L1_9ACTN|nr:hypothetical protein [Kribbella shirazensis]NIK59402.1 MinD-like ATPase involved in chromosome partitioning or flagellar assembly [Kribbella shirazensis]
MTDPDWQSDMLRRMSAERPPADEPAHTGDAPPAAAQPPEEPVLPADQPSPPQASQQPPYQQLQHYQQFQQYQQAMPPPGRGRREDDGGESVFDKFRRVASDAAYVIGGSGRLQRDVDLISTCRRPIAITRRVGVTSPVTDGGTSTVTALLSTMLAAQRADRVVAVDVDPVGAELSRRLELTLGAGAIEGVSLVRSDPTVPALRSTLAAAQSQGARDVGLAVVDCPGSMFDEIATEMANTGHCTVLVVPSVQHVASHCLYQLDQLAPAGQDLLLSRGVVVITLVENADLDTTRWLSDAFRQRGLEPVVLPHDPHIAGAWPLHSSELETETRRAVLELAARVVGIVTRSPS